MDLFRRKSNTGINATIPETTSDSSSPSSSSLDSKGKTAAKNTSPFSSHPSTSSNSQSPSRDHTPPRQTSIPDLQALPHINVSPFSFPTHPTPLSNQPSPFLSASASGSRPSNAHPRSHDPSGSQNPTHTFRAASLSVKRSRNNLKHYASLPPSASSRGLAIATGSSSSQHPSTGPSPSVLRKASSVDSMARHRSHSGLPSGIDALIGSPQSPASSSTGGTATRTLSEAPTPRMADGSKELAERLSPGGVSQPPKGEGMLGLGLGLGPPPRLSPTSSRARHQLPRLRSSRVGQSKAAGSSSRVAGSPPRNAGGAGNDVEYESDFGTSGSEVGMERQGSGGGFDADEEDADEDRVEVIWQRSPHLRADSSESSESENEDEDEDDVGEEEWIQDPTTVSNALPSDLLRHVVTLPTSLPTSPHAIATGTLSSSIDGDVSPTSPFFRAPIQRPSEYALSETGNRLAQNEAEIMASARRKMQLGSSSVLVNAPALLRTSSFPNTSSTSPLINPRTAHLQQQGRGSEAALGWSPESTGTPSSSSSRPRAASASSGSLLGGGSPEIVSERASPKRGERRSTLPGSDGGVEMLNSPRVRVVSQLPPIPIAVVGHRGCGKTRIVKEAFRRYGYPLSEPQLLPGVPGTHLVEIRSARVSTKTRINQDVHIYEIDLNTFQIEDGKIIWPEGIPRVEAIAICYDAGDLSSWKGVREFFRAREPDIPSCVFGCKSGGAPRPVEVVPQEVVSAIGKLVVVSVEEEKITQKMHQGFCWLVEQAIKRVENPVSIRSPPASQPYAFPEPIYPPKPTRSKPLQVDTALPISTDAPGTSSSSIISTFQGNQAAFFERNSPENFQRPLPSHLEGGGERRHTKAVGSVSSQTSSSNGMAGSGLDRSWVAGEEKGAGTSSMGGSMIVETSKEGSSVAPSDRLKKKEGHGGTYLSLREIVQLLFYHSVRSSDHLFSRTFFACYRRFSRPQDVISLFISEFDLLEGKRLAGVYAQLKICGVLNYWLDHYPNDFAVPKTQGLLRDMINRISSKVPLAHHAAKLLPFYRRMDKLKVEDPVWAKSDRDGDPRASQASYPSSTHLPQDSSQMGILIETTQTSTVSYLSSGASVSGSDLPAPHIMNQSLDNLDRPPHSRTGSIVSLNRGRSDSDISSRPTNHSSDGFASSGLPSADTSMSKTSSRGSGNSSIPSAPPPIVVDVWESKAMQRMVQRFLDSSDQQIANDITRLDWKYFEQIRPRSLLAHCYSGGSEEGGDPLLRQFSTHFNDLSSLFCILVLSQSKLRARVRVYERILTIIDLLRSQNNYMALSSLTASFGQLSVERLRETIELAMDLKTSRNKINRFQSHLKLVDGRSSYKTYKMSIKEDERSGKQGVLLIPSIMKELIQIRELFNRVKQAHRDQNKADDLINWREFERFGEVFTAVAGCQSRGSPVPASSAPNVVAQMLKDRPDIEEKALGDRSLFLEPPDGGTTSISSALRRFGMRHT